jgi:hypothetical protein
VNIIYNYNISINAKLKIIVYNIIIYNIIIKNLNLIINLFIYLEIKLRVNKKVKT